MSEEKKYNYGILILRLLLTLAVILNHFWDVENPGVLKPMYLLRSCAVPTFMLLSFFLTEKAISAPSVVNLKKRIARLATPFFVWGGKLASTFSR